MEFVHGELIASKCEAKDFISSMPDNVITKILNRLPLRDAVSTGILSRTWRLKWTLITKLVFDDDLYENFRGWGGKPNGKDLSRLINQLKGPITKFNLDIPEDDYPDDILFNDEDVNHWLSVLSRKGIKKLNIISQYADPHELPIQLFSCLELKHLLLYNCFFHLPPSFCGFPKLLNLVLSSSRFEGCTFGELITRCPLLEALRIDADETVDDVEVAEIVKHGNLKILNLSLCVFERITSSSIFHLTDLPKLEKLYLNFDDCEFVADAGVGKKVTTAFLSLKTLNLSRVDLNDDLMVSFISEMICGSPNLHNLYILAKYERNVPPRADSDCNTMGMLHLRSVEFSCYKSSENEVRFIKSLLACSPLLEKIKIHGSSRAFSGDKVKLMFATKLLMLPRASPTAEVDFSWV
ncbi:F-box/FBD/LRR-repeat protein-like protein [Tanacetum coccineum]